MRLFIFILIATVLFSCRQSSKIPGDFDYGKTENGVYTNKYFGMNVAIPSGWKIQSSEIVDSLLNKGNKLLAEKNKEVAEHAEKGRARTPLLLWAFKYPLDSAIIGYNPQFIIMAEKLNPLSSIKTGLDYLENERKLMEQAKIGFHVTSDYTVKKIGDKDFDVLRFTKAVGEQMDIQRVYHVRIEKGFALDIIVTHASNKQEEELNNVLRQIKFN